MLALCKGHRPQTISLSSTERYFPEHLLNLAGPLGHSRYPIYLKVCNTYLPIRNKTELDLAAQIVATFHNEHVTSAPFEDHWHAETEAMEDEAARHMEDEDYCSDSF